MGRWRLGLSLLVLALGGSSVWAQGAVSPAGAPSAPPFPTHPVKIILPSPPGGVTDLLGRMLGQRLAQKPGIGKPVTGDFMRRHTGH